MEFNGNNIIDLNKKGFNIAGELYRVDLEGYLIDQDGDNEFIITEFCKDFENL